MKVLAVAASKGGVGKTTLTAHIGVEAMNRGHAVALIDLDPQGSLTYWRGERDAFSAEPHLIPATTAQLSARLDQVRDAGAALAIIDTPPGHMATIKAAVAVADLVLVPFTPSPLDIAAIGPTVAACAGKPVTHVVNRAASRRRLSREAAELLERQQGAPAVVIRDLSAFAAAMTDGRAAQELDPNSPAAADAAALFDAIADRISL